MSNTFLIKLQPLDRFFFGGGVTFGKDNEDYFVRSLKYPQQTTLLGMLRYLLLFQNDLLEPNGKVKNKPKAEELIGPSSFNPSKVNQLFGVIEKLSPLFIYGPEGPLFVQSREFGEVTFEDIVTEEKKKTLLPLKIVKRESSGTEQYYFDTKKHKVEYPQLLVNAMLGRIHYEDEIFFEDEQVGIKITKGGPDEKAYFRQVGYRLPYNYSFAFYATLNSSQLFNFQNDVKMGAEKSCFKIEVTKEELSIEDLFVRKDNSLVNNLYRTVNDIDKKIVLLSDSFIDRELYDSLPFVSGDIVHFKCMQTFSDKTGKGGFLIEKAKLNLKKIESTYTFLKKGSVLFLDNKKEKETIVQKIEKKEPFRSIGYNYVI